MDYTKDVSKLQEMMEGYLEKNARFSVKLYKCRLNVDSSYYDPTPSHTMTLSKENFDSPQAFLPSLNKESKKYKYEFTFSKSPPLFHVESTGDYCLKLSPSLAEILGFSNPNHNSNLLCPQKLSAKSTPFLHRGIDTIFVYSDIVDEVFVGDVKAPLLLICPFKTNPQGHNAHQEFLNPDYVPVNRSTIRTIDIRMRDGVGEEIPFTFGKTVISLHFRKLNA
jgi:hypothetical protein